MFVERKQTLLTIDSRAKAIFTFVDSGVLVTLIACAVEVKVPVVP
jgi:hypothetical protein